MAATFKATIPASKEDAGVLLDLLTELLDPPPAAAPVETESGWVVEAYFTEAPPAEALAAVAEACPGVLPPEGLQLVPIADEDWVARVQRGLHPVRAGRFLIHGSHDRAKAANSAFAIEIEAGQAFGTAHHATTRGCLLAIDALAKSVHIDRVLDLGTGTGVLAIAAAMVWHGDVLATDIDPVSVEVAAENIVLNGVAGHIEVLTGDGLRHPQIAAHAPYGLVIANILAGPLVSFAPGLPRLLGTGGYLVLSGMLRTQAREVTARYVAQGFVLTARYPLDEWMTLVLQRRGPQQAG